MIKTLKDLGYYSKCSFMFLLKMSKEYVILTLLGIVLNSVSVFPNIYLVRYSVELITRHVGFPFYVHVITIIILLGLFISLTRNLLTNRLAYVRDRMFAKIQLEIDCICLGTEYEKIQSEVFQQNKAFAVATLQNGYLDLFINSVKQMLSSLLIMVGVLYIISEASFWILIPLAISLTLGFYYDFLNARQNFEEIKEETEYRRKSNYLQSISRDFQYAKEIRLFQLKDKFKKRMDEVDDLLFRAREIRRKQRAPSGWLFYGSESLLNIAVYLYFGYQILFAKAMTPGLFTACHSALWQMKNSVQDILYTITNYSIHTESLKAFFGFMDHQSPLRPEAYNVTRLPDAEIRFEHVSFRYPSAEEDTLHDISITISAGEKLLIVGENGAGKSTFIKLLCGLYQPTDGNIYLNDVDISTIDRKQYLRQISAVFQDYQLFAFTISENISALHDTDETFVHRALSQVNMAAPVEKTSHGIFTVLYRIFDPEGVEFSGGEMQRLAIARAICKDTPILVLDEPTSALDPKAEHDIYTSFRSISENRSTVFISHRLTSVKFCDTIAVFDKGRIAEYGTHESLIKKQGLYAELYTMQSGLYDKR